MEAARIIAAASGLPRSKPELLLMAQAMNCMPTGEVTIATLSDAIKNARLGQGPHPARVTMVPPEIHVGPNGEPQMLHGPRWNLHTQLGSTLLHEQLPFRSVPQAPQQGGQAERHAGQFPVTLENGLPRIEAGAGPFPCSGDVSDAEEISQIAYPEGTWIVSQNIAGKARTLHRIGAGVCWRVPGIHYKYFEALSEDVSDLSEVEIMRLFDQPCKDCFPKLKGGASGSASQESSSSGDESSVA